MPKTPKSPKDTSTADYAEVMEILTAMARGGDVRAAIALAGHLRKEQDGAEQPKSSKVDELARKRGGRCG